MSLFLIPPMRSQSVTFETKVWEGDWELIMNTARLEEMIGRCGYDFESKVLLINNFKTYAAVEKRAATLRANQIIDSYYIVETYAEQALDFFEVSKESLGAGYVYSIAELVGLYVCKSEYLLHFSGDSIPMPNISADWLSSCLNVLNKNPCIKVANLGWDTRTAKIAAESDEFREGFFIGYGFSDQMYLIRTKDFRAPIYGCFHPDGKRYPAYGGNLFEKRVDAWMRNSGFKRATHASAFYRHRNFPRKPWGRMLWKIFREF